MTDAASSFEAEVVQAIKKLTKKKKKTKQLKASLCVRDMKLKASTSMRHMLRSLEGREQAHKLKMAGFLRALQKVAVKDMVQKQQQQETNTQTTSKTKAQPPPQQVDMMDSMAFFSQLEENHQQVDATATTTLSFADIHWTNMTADDARRVVSALLESPNAQLAAPQLIDLLQAATNCLAHEDTVVDMTATFPAVQEVAVVGDIHGSLPCLQSILELLQVWTLGTTNRVIVFDGDFVDRGRHSTTVLVTLLLLKLSHPRQVYLLRGAHEDTMTACTYSFRDEIEGLYSDDYEQAAAIWESTGRLFAALPLIAKSRCAVILHGGLCAADLELHQINQQLTPSLRCELTTVVTPYDDEEKLVQGLLWSDPSDTPGLQTNKNRGAGMLFGSDICNDFLARHGLQYMIRAHETCPEGYSIDDVGDNRAIITVFSTADYPNGEGFNDGAVFILNEMSGEYDAPRFNHDEENDQDGDDDRGGGDAFTSSWLTSIIGANKTKLTKAFQKKESSDGTITIQEWADILSKKLDLPDVKWVDIQPEIAPTNEASAIDWKDFITRFSSSAKDLDLDALDEDQAKLLHHRDDKYLKIFQILDTDKNGTLSKEEFITGIEMLNDKLSNKDDAMNIKKAAKLYDQFDLDHNGELDIQEFCLLIKKSRTLRSATRGLGSKQIQNVKENNEMLLMAFKYLDTDHSGTIDREEFERAVTLLNGRLPEEQRIGDPNALFDLVDVDGSGEIGK